ncbi:MAG: glycoside hydrolase family 38 C-terminal domain-containing protein [Promethearchaeota archaeon]
MIFIKPVKQKGQKYVKLDLRLESVVDAIMYHPWNRKRKQKKYRKGKYLRRVKFWSAPTRRKYGTLKGLNLYFCGVSHLDAAWLFPVIDTKERAYKTFYKAVEHCELYPFFIFAQTSPQYYLWIKKYDKSLWEKVKQKVKEGRIEPTGGMWIEPDLEIPCGESLVRQRLYGQLFYLREFGFYPRMSSLLDVFGYPWSLPQVLLKSGAEYFWTTKLQANDTIGWPFCMFYWQGIDGSRIFTYEFTYNWYALQSSNRFRRMARRPNPKYNHTIFTSHNFQKEIEEKFSKKKNDYIKDFAIWYGLGDGGRGPMEIEIFYADALQKFHNGKHLRQHDYMQLIRKKVGDLYFIWNDELYFEYHRGTKTSQSLMKHLNRKAELWLIAAEKLATIINIYFSNAFSIDKSHYFETWRKILFNQFHDILPGTSIPDVYLIAHHEVRTSINYSIATIESCLSVIDKFITNNINNTYNYNSNIKDANKTDKGIIKKSAGNVIIYNPFSWTRSEIVFIKQKCYLLKDIPPISINIFDQNEFENNFELKINNVKISEDENYFVLENDKIVAKIDREYGGIISLFSKKYNKEFISPEKSLKNRGSGLRVFHERAKRWRTWNIQKEYPLQKIPIKISEKPHINQINFPNYQSSVIKSTSTSDLGDSIQNKLKCVKTKYAFGKSSCEVFFFILPGEDIFRVRIKTNMRDGEFIVKYFIPLKSDSKDVVAEIPYGHIVRKRVKTTEREKAKWEMSMQKWINISDDNLGIAILNDNRYGFSATKNGVYLTLVRTPTYPGVSPLYGATRLLPKKLRPKYIDFGIFEYNFALLPHENPFDYSYIQKRSYNFNFPLIIYMSNQGILNKIYELPFYDNKVRDFNPSLQKRDISSINNMDSSFSFVIFKYDQNTLSLENPTIETLNKINQQPFLEITKIDKENNTKANQEINVIIESIKPPEWCGNDLNQILNNNEWNWNQKSFILRLVEYKGEESSFALKLNSLLQIKSIRELNLLEMPISKNNNTAILHFDPFEIKTIQIILSENEK